MHLGGGLGLDAGFGRKLRGHKVTSAELGDYVERVVRSFVKQRTEGERFAQWVRARRRGGPASERGGGMSERAVPFYCPYCGDEDLRPSEVGPRRLVLRGLPAHVHAEDDRDRGAVVSVATEVDLRATRRARGRRAGPGRRGRGRPRLGGRRRSAGRMIVASNMQDAVLVDLAAKALPGVEVLFLDTGYHFAETIGTRDAVEHVYDVKIVNAHARAHRRRAGHRVRQGPLRPRPQPLLRACARSSR